MFKVGDKVRVNLEGADDYGKVGEINNKVYGYTTLFEVVFSDGSSAIIANIYLELIPTEYPTTKLEDLPLVEVRDSESEEWLEAYFLAEIDTSEYPIKVLSKDECAFSFKYMRPIQEPKMRPMTHMEIIEALKKYGCALKDNHGDFSNYWDSDFSKNNTSITYDGGKTWGKLEVPKWED